MDYLQKIIRDIELHSVEGIKECFSNGINPNTDYNNEPLINELISEYTRSSRFKDCVQAFIDAGLEFNDKALLSVLKDDHYTLDYILKDSPATINKKYSFRCAYTPMLEVALLHICAEFNHLYCAKTLLKYGADINAKAGIEEHGFGGQTPVFHTVNQNSNQSSDVLNYLLTKNPDLQITVAGLIWGKGYEWETLIPSVNPISYAMMGMLPQMHRNEFEISDTVSQLLKAAYGIDYTPANVPCAYLEKLI